MASPVGSERNLERLLEHVLLARPDATLADIRNLAPAFRSTADVDLAALAARIRQRLSAKRAQRRRRIKSSKLPSR